MQCDSRVILIAHVMKMLDLELILILQGIKLYQGKSNELSGVGCLYVDRRML